MTGPRPGRKGHTELHVIPGGPGIHRLQPPADLDADAARLFRELVASLPPNHFAACDGPLLAVYTEALVIARRSAAKLHKDPKALAVWEKASRLLASLSSKLRVCPSSRSDPKTVARATMDHRPSYYDLQRADDWQSK